MKEILEDEELMERLLGSMRDSEKWFREACESYLQHSYQKPPAIVNVPKNHLRHGSLPVG